MKNKQAFASTFLIVFAFFLGYMFEKRVGIESQVRQKEDKQYVNIIIKKKQLEFVTSSPNVQVLVNGKDTLSGSITLE